MNGDVILRIDDIGRKNYFRIIPSMLEELVKREMPYVLGVIACELEKDNNYITSLDRREEIEFALHGYYHEKDTQGNPEFKLLSKDEARVLIKKGKSIMQEKLDVTPTTFIPPWNSASAATKNALVEEGFKVFSGIDKYETSPLISLGCNASTATFGPHALVPLEKIKDDLQISLDQRGYCVIMIHPQDYLVDDIGDQHKPEVDPEKYKQFTSLLDYLGNTNSNITTFKEMATTF
ncbi:DUF2334 domain-containing protein [Candidatus Pacearchaeota archaeon]|nr:DUF2334 domain-containing protein [Candidatus Pacearchaeota archaeon]